MEHVNTTNIRQQQQQQHQQLQQHQLEQEQQHNENQQQFCLRWHNHQSSLLSTLPILLDQSHLTDVTISAEGRTLRAHRVVLSACSTFFMELFRALEASNHPVIIIPGASFAAIVALLTFMYSGEVNVYEEQIPVLLNLAETLGIKGLADVQNNLQKSSKSTPNYFDSLRKDAEFERPITPPTPTPSTPNAHALLGTLNAPNALNVNNKFVPCTPLENLFLKSLQFYPNLLPQPLNFSQTALNKTTEFLAKYQQQCNLYQGVLGMAQAKDFLPLLEQQDILRNACKDSDDAFAAKRFCSREKINQQVNPNVSSPTQQQKQQQHQQHQQKDIKRIDRIVENLRVGDVRTSRCISPQAMSSNTHGNHNTTNTEHSPTTSQSMQQNTPTPPLALKSTSGNYTAVTHASHLYTTKPTLYNTTPPTFTQAMSQQSQTQQIPTSPYISAEDHAKLQQHMEQYAASQREQTAHMSTTNSLGTVKSEPNLLALTEKLSSVSSAATTPPTKSTSNSKLYATCFICHKQLSNQYNLRVHLETHQNVRYACNVCSHVSRSKDALRKHVSYRHPGAPSPCETEARRKRVSKLATAPLSSTATTIAATATATPTTLNASVTSDEPAKSGPAALGTTRNFQLPNDTQLAQHLGSSSFMFLPNQFHLAAAAAASAAADTRVAVDVTSSTATTPAVASVLDLAHNNNSASAGAPRPGTPMLHNDVIDEANMNSSSSTAVASPTAS